MNDEGHKEMANTTLEAGEEYARGPRPPVRIGTMTRWGRIVAIGSIAGDRYYWVENQMMIVSMLPASMLEDS